MFYQNRRSLAGQFGGLDQDSRDRDNEPRAEIPIKLGLTIDWSPHQHRRMQYDQRIHPLLMCRRLPGRVDVAAAATLLGFKEHDIPLLMAAKLLKPLGKPAPNAPKYFSSRHLIELSEDQSWLDRATKATSDHWRFKRERGLSKQMRQAHPVDQLTSPVSTDNC